MKIVKIINNNTVCAVDEKGKEQIVSGKEIGFGKKRGEAIDPAQIQKIYMITDSALRKRMVECLSEIPYEHIQLTSELVDYISSRISEILNESLMISLSDHISFAIERQKQGIAFANPLMDSIHDYFPEELALGRYCVEEIRRRLYRHAHHQCTAPHQYGTDYGLDKAGECLRRNCRYFLSGQAGQDHGCL